MLPANDLDRWPTSLKFIYQVVDLPSTIETSKYDIENVLVAFINHYFIASKFKRDRFRNEEEIFCENLL